MMPSKKDRNKNKNRNNLSEENKLSPDFGNQTKAQAKKNDGYRSRY